ncbi:YceI family protein [Paraflavitalea sp. CAU 1676]|uniref:YceI family protein n=1 Tax=Paraflavitalea sp. CAU 1676 TaxID=3032598 RepID=UPI0023DB48E4|nr:YceI family protein [Paraflavitalea sp. CAU 1676]MDF2193624.1 YceI family protein [Paraflavitalea sp. CAU 1676]
MNLRVIGIAKVLLLLSVLATAQDRYFTKSGKISFVSKGNIETIAAKHKGVTCVLDAKSGALQFAVLMKGFEFAKALMQEHFNENYVESDKYPKGDFKGQVSNNGDVKYGQDGVYAARVKGTLTIHGISKEIEVPGNITIGSGKPQLNASFNILLSDYQIKIPAIVKENISNTVTITIDCPLDPLK